MTKYNVKMINITNNCYKYDKKLLQIRKASNIDITKLQIIITNVGATNEQTNENKTNKASHYYMILIIIT